MVISTTMIIMLFSSDFWATLNVCTSGVIRTTRITSAPNMFEAKVRQKKKIFNEKQGDYCRRQPSLPLITGCTSHTWADASFTRVYIYWTIEETQCSSRFARFFQCNNVLFSCRQSLELFLSLSVIPTSIPIPTHSLIFNLITIRSNEYFFSLIFLVWVTSKHAARLI